MRFALAWMVAALHLTKDASVQPAAAYAVCGFYVISGYLITAILNESYQGRPLAFWVNRFLRLFPTYYVVAAATALLLAVYPVDDQLWTRLFGWNDFWGNLTIVWFEFYGAERDFRLVPPAWSVAVEIVNYFIIWAFAARHPRCAVAFLGVGIAVHVLTAGAGLGWYWRYTPWFAAMLPFACGSVTYFLLRDGIRVPGKLAPVVLGLWAANLLFGSMTTDVHWYANIVLLAGLLSSTADERLAGLGRHLGDLSYPVFLSHYFVAAVVFLALPIDGYGWALFGVSVPAILLTSVGLAWFSRRCIDPLRDNVRSSERQAAPAVA